MRRRAVAAGLAAAAVFGVAVYGAMTIAQGDSRWPLPWKKLRGASESMAPTIRLGAQLTARRKPASELRRGDVVAFWVGNEFWVQRLVGLSGDRIAMRNGLIVLNGSLVPQADINKTVVNGETVSVRSERLPGEAAAHHVLDYGATRSDDMPAVQVPPGKLFLVGDNRDNSMDSRFPAGTWGIGGGMVAFADVYGTISPEDIGD